MKKLLLISLSALLALSLGACTAPPPPSSSAPSISVAPPASVNSESNTEQDLKQPPIPADAAMYRGSVTALTTDPSNNKLVQVTLTQAEGTDFGAPSLKFAFTADTYADFTPEQGQYLEVYYGVAPGQQVDVNEVHNILTAIKYHTADMVNYNGYVKSIETHPDKPNKGWIMMSLTPEAVSSTASGSVDINDPQLPTVPVGNEIRFNYDKDETKFYLSFDEIKVGDRLNIFQSGAMTMSIPPQSFAIEVRPYAETSETPTPKTTQ